MGWWSRLKKAVKKAVKVLVKKIRAYVRIIVRFVLAIVFAAINLWDLLFGFLNWPPKNLTLQVFILSDKNGPLIEEKEKLAKLNPSIEYARRVLKQRLNIRLRFYSTTFVDILKEPAPDVALHHKPCTLSGVIQNDSGDAGDYYAKHIAGWNGIPISLRFPITVFIIQEVKDDEKYNYVGCSAGPLSDYVVVDLEGIKDPPASTMMHEMGHCCNIIGHPGTNLNDLMYGSDKEGEIFRGDNVRGWQRNLIRASRHVTYW